MQDYQMGGAGVRPRNKESMLAACSIEKADCMMDKVNAFQSILSKVVPERECLNQIKERKNAQTQAPGARRMRRCVLV